jgi:hypothetical protein
LQSLQDPREINGDNLNNIRCETSRHCRNKKKEYLKDKINELATNSKNKNIRDLYRAINDLIYLMGCSFFFGDLSVPLYSFYNLIKCRTIMYSFIDH